MTASGSRSSAASFTTQQLFEFRWNRIFGPRHQADGAAFEKRFLDLLYETAIPVDGADEICRYLKEKYILCAASNAFHDQQLNRLEMAGLYSLFLTMVICFRVARRASEKGVFDACRAFLPDVAADECIMIGDSLTADISGGKAAGMKTIWYNHTHRPVPERCEADQIVDSLLKLKNLL